MGGSFADADRDASDGASGLPGEPQPALNPGTTRRVTASAKCSARIALASSRSAKFRTSRRRCRLNSAGRRFADDLRMTSSNAGEPGRAKRLHVLEVVGNAIVGGMESYVTRLVERLPRTAYVLTALCPFESRFTEGLRARGVDVVTTPITDDPSWSSIQMACALIGANGIDVLHAHLPNAHVLAGIAGKLTHTPALATIHGRQPSSRDLEVQRCTGTHIGVVSRHSYFHALGMGVDKDRLSCIPNGVDTDVFKPRPRQSGGLRARLSVPDDAPLVGFVGRLSHEKGPEVAIRAALLLRRSVPDAHLVLIGEGPMRAELLELIDRFDLGNRVQLAGMHEDMHHVYHELDALVSTSHSEAMPLVLMEAMASGLPVVASRVGGVPDLVEHGETGWLVSPGDFHDTAARLTQLLLSVDDRQRMGARARERMLNKFSLADCVGKTADLLAQLAAPAGGGRVAWNGSGAARSVGNGARPIHAVPDSHA